MHQQPNKQTIQVESGDDLLRNSLFHFRSKYESTLKANEPILRGIFAGVRRWNGWERHLIIGIFSSRIIPIIACLLAVKSLRWSLSSYQMGLMRIRLITHLCYNHLANSEACLDKTLAQRSGEEPPWFYAKTPSKLFTRSFKLKYAREHNMSALSTIQARFLPSRTSNLGRPYSY